MPYTATDFGRTVREDYERRAGSGLVIKASADEAHALPGRALGHPDFSDMRVGEFRSINVACVFLDLSDFTGRTFWDDPHDTALLAHAVSPGTRRRGQAAFGS